MNAALQLLSVFILSTCIENASAQQKPVILNTSLTEPAKSLAYAGVDNLFLIKGEIPGKYIRIERSGGPLEMRNGMSMKAIVRYAKTGSDTFRIYADDQLVLEKVYQIVPTGPFEVKLNNLKDSVCSSGQFIKSKGLELCMPGTLYKPKGKILSYNLSVIQNGRVRKSFSVESGALPGELLASQDLLSPGTRLVFEKISVQMPGNSISAMKAIRLQIK